MVEKIIKSKIALETNKRIVIMKTIEIITMRFVTSLRYIYLTNYFCLNYINKIFVFQGKNLKK